MKQVIQDFKTGKLYVGEVPAPIGMPGYVLVRNYYSLISSGTEKMTVSAAQASLLGKAKQRPDLVRMVLDNLRKEGLQETIKKVRTKLNSLRELGYSCSGKVILSLDTNDLFKPGDKVACGGGYASHSEFVLVPQNLVVKIPDSVGLDLGAFATLGAIALQGVRQTDPKIGDLVCVIGLGLIGQITAQILRANGCKVLGIDISERMVKIGNELSCDRALNRNDPSIFAEIDNFTGGNGFDSVIITASAKTNDPLVMATQILRKKGIMVLVGAVPINVPRDPDFYRKELELKISCSYGPGRYDPLYEEKGQDYPYAYVRWTENRNMKAFLELVESGKVNIEQLITHVFDIEKASEAYDLITGKKEEPFLGVLISYLGEKEVSTVVEIRPPRYTQAKVKVGFVGAGSFAQKFLIPEAKKKTRFISVVTAHGLSARNVADKFEFERCSTDPDDIFGDKEINTVFIATRHNTHARYVISALEANKNVFVEKPLAMNQEELELIAEAYKEHKDCKLMVGFNRRFSPLAKEASRTFADLRQPKIVNYRVNAGPIPSEHWIQSDEGGGRIIGEICHFLDFIQYVTNGYPERVFAESIKAFSKNVPAQDNLVVSVYLSDGSIGVITYTSSGSVKLGKEKIEVFCGGNSFIIDDFRKAFIYQGNRLKKIQGRGKGHHEEIEEFIRSIETGSPSPIDFDSLYLTTLTTFKIVEALKTRQSVQILNT